MLLNNLWAWKEFDLAMAKRAAGIWPLQDYEVLHNIYVQMKATTTTAK